MSSAAELALNGPMSPRTIAAGAKFCAASAWKRLQSPPTPNIWRPSTNDSVMPSESRGRRDSASRTSTMPWTCGVASYERTHRIGIPCGDAAHAASNSPSSHASRGRCGSCFESESMYSSPRYVAKSGSASSSALPKTRRPASSPSAGSPIVTVPRICVYTSGRVTPSACGHNAGGNRGRFRDS